jgi:hypothetical protein
VQERPELRTVGTQRAACHYAETTSELLRKA